MQALDTPPAASSPEADAEAFRHAVQHFSRVVGNARLLALVLDRNGRVVYCNDYMLHLTDWQWSDVEGADWFTRFLPPPHEPMRAAFEQLLRDSPSIWCYENAILTRSRRQILLRWNNSLIRSASSTVVGTASIAQVIERESAHPREESNGEAVDPRRLRDMVLLANTLMKNPDATALPFVRLVVEQCAQQAEIGNDPTGAAIARRLRKLVS